MGLVDGVEVEELFEASVPWLDRHLTSGDYIGWLVQSGDEVVAGAGVNLQERVPVPGCYRVGLWAHIANFYTAPQHRRRGLARLLMTTILEWTRLHEVDHVTLVASDEGRPLYESLGFRPTSDMALPPRAASIRKEAG